MMQPTESGRGFRFDSGGSPRDSTLNKKKNRVGAPGRGLHARFNPRQSFSIAVVHAEVSEDAPIPVFCSKTEVQSDAEAERESPRSEADTKI